MSIERIIIPMHEELRHPSTGRKGLQEILSTCSVQCDTADFKK